MKVVLAIVLFLFVQVYAKSCDPLRGLGFNPACDNKKQPYCRTTVIGTSSLNTKSYQ